VQHPLSMMIQVTLRSSWAMQVLLQTLATQFQTGGIKGVNYGR